VNLSTENSVGLALLTRVLSGKAGGVEGGSTAAGVPVAHEVGSLGLADVAQSLSPGLTMFATFRQLHLDTALRALETDTRFKILSTPFVQVLNHERAYISVGQSVPYITAQVNQFVGGGGSNGVGQVVGASVGFLDVAVQLMVTPHATEDGYVTLEVEQTANDAGGTVLLAGNPVPIQNRRVTRSKLLIRDGDTVALGGLIREQVETNETRVPVLSHIPYLGRAFRTKDVTRQRSELVILLHPMVSRDAVNQVGMLAERKRDK
jgi:general secretion pathway protein D